MVILMAYLRTVTIYRSGPISTIVIPVLFGCSAKAFPQGGFHVSCVGRVLLDAGNPPHCGFCFSLHEWPEVRVHQVYVSFDREGDLPRPSLGLVQID